MKNKEKVLNMIDTAVMVNNMKVSDMIVGDYGDTVDGWLRCNHQVMDELLAEIRNTINTQEVEF